MELSIVIPVYRSAKNAFVHLPLIIDTLRGKYKNFEVIFIIDYPKVNHQLQAFIDLCEKYKEVKIQLLNKNYGQHFATLCGYYIAKGNFIACVDEDMSAYIVEICKTDAYKNFDVFYFYYDKNKMYNSSVRKFFSILYKYLIRKIVNLKKHSTFRVISKELRDKMLIDKHYYWNLDVMTFDNTNKISGITIQDCTITDDNTTYNYKKLLKIAFEIAYENNPIFMNMLFSIVPALLFYFITKNIISTSFFYLLLIVTFSWLFNFIKKKNSSTTKKILAALKN